MKCLNLMKPHVCSSRIKRYVIGAIQHTHTNRYSGYIFYSLKKKKHIFNILHVLPPQMNDHHTIAQTLKNIR